MDAMSADIVVACAHDFRRGLEGQASEGFLRVVEHLGRFFAEHPDDAPAMVPWLSDLLEAQSRGDYLFVADLLEYEIAPRLVVVPAPPRIG